MSRNFYFQQPQNQCECGHLNNYEHSGKQLQIRGFQFFTNRKNAKPNNVCHSNAD